MTVALSSNDAGEIKTEPARRPIRIQDLLRHSSGLTYAFFGKGPAREALNKVNEKFAEMTNREISKALASLPLEHQPGTKWEYSRATDVLGVLLEVVDGVSLGESLRTRIFDPLKMNDTGFWVKDAADHARIAEAMPEDRGIGKFKMFDPRKKGKFESGGGGLVSTIHDYARFAQMVMNGGELEGTRILSPQTVAVMTADHLGDRIKRGKYHFIGDGAGFGLGFGVRTAQGLGNRIGSVGDYYWGGAGGTSYVANPKNKTILLYMMQSPKHRRVVRPIIQNVAASAFIGDSAATDKPVILSGKKQGLKVKVGASK